MDFGLLNDKASISSPKWRYRLVGLFCDRVKLSVMV